MSIQFNDNDYRIADIRRDSRLGHMVTQFRYYIFGLSNDDENPPIRIRFGRAVSAPQLAALQRLFAGSQMDMVSKPLKGPLSRYKVHIGLRYDLRGHVPVCSAILQTIIYHLEGRLALDPGQLDSCILPGIPKTRAPHVR